MIRTLPIFKGYTVDLQLQEFRKIESGNLPEFVPLLSDKGASLFYEFKHTEEGQKEIDHYWGRKQGREHPGINYLPGLFLSPQEH